MGEHSSIQWTTHTFSPWWGCVKVSEECRHCYAATFARRLGYGGERLPLIWGPESERRFFGDKHWSEPLRWNRVAAASGEPTRVFCASMSDVFEDRPDLDAPRGRLKRLIEDTPALDWLLLTKRPENMLRLGWGEDADAWPDNIWAGTTVGAVPSVTRLLHLERVPVRVRFVSMEPLLADLAALPGLVDLLRPMAWVIIGGESGAGARPMPLEWVHGLIRAARRAGCAPFTKQLGSVWARSVGAKDSHGGDPSEWPEAFPREFPEAA